VSARIKGVLRRIQPSIDATKITSGGIELNEVPHQVTAGGRDLKLTPMEFSLLKLMMSHPGRVFTRNELVSRIQVYDYEGCDPTIDTHVKNLRKRLANMLPDQDIISSVYGMGYKYQA